jgi:phosphate-selective porin OprO/OprP
LTDVTLGANWYLNPYLRVTANYVRAFLTPRNGPRGATDFYGVRIGYEF